MTSKQEGPAPIAWQRWFAWCPVYIVDRWYWLQYVAREQYANKPSRFRYARFMVKELE